MESCVGSDMILDMLLLKRGKGRISFNNHEWAQRGMAATKRLLVIQMRHRLTKAPVPRAELSARGYALTGEHGAPGRLQAELHTIPNSIDSFNRTPRGADACAG